jgi:hypothetical protein
MTMILETLQGLFADKLIEDDREPIATFELPLFSGESGLLWGLYAPKLHLWHQLITMLLLQTVVQCFFAAIIYQFIIQQRRTVTAYLLGWGVIISIVFYFPYLVLVL